MADFKPIRWGILGAGHIAGEFADGVKGSCNGTLLAIGSRSLQKARAFAEQMGVPRSYGCYEDLLSDSEVDAVYIATPHPMHAEWTIKAAEAGKHIVVEKPIAMNWYEAMAMVDAARIQNVFLMEAFMYRCHPQMQKLVKLIESGIIGEVRLIQAAFSYHSTAGNDSRAFAMDLGGGGILDVGCYAVSLARMVAGAACGKPFEEPTRVKGFAALGETGVDEWAAATLEFPGKILAQVSCGVRLNQGNANSATVWGSKGSIHIPDPWTHSRWNREPALLIWHKNGNDPEEIRVDAPKDLYTYEAEMAADNISQRQAPAMTWADTLGNMRVLDAWRQDAGVVYELEKPQNGMPTLTHRPLAKSLDAPMPCGFIAGLNKPISRLIFGCDSNNHATDTLVMLDDYFEKGGNTFDTSHGYGNPDGACERNLGWWVENRGIRDHVVIIEKGANPPHANPEGLTAELIDGLDRLQVDCVDIYFIHRDNIEIPIDEWMDCLNQNQAAGRMKVFGVSNFTLPRIIAAQEYAHRKGLNGFSAISNNFSLARMLHPVWDLCVACSDDPFREWFIRTQMPLMPWSSQGRGFFTPNAAPDKLNNKELVTSWYSPENFDRKARAEKLARKYQVEPINIALAYVLCQPFPTFPLIGPKQLSETRSCIGSLNIKLTPEEVAWLDLRD